MRRFVRKRNAEMKLTSSVTCNRHPRRARPPRKLYVCRRFAYKMTFPLTSEKRTAYSSVFFLLFSSERLLEARRFAAIHGKQAKECLTSTAPKSAGNSCLYWSGDRRLKLKIWMRHSRGMPYSRLLRRRLLIIKKHLSRHARNGLKTTFS